MSSTGMFVLFAGLGILLIVGMSALDSLHAEVNTTNDTGLAAQNDTAKAIENPIFIAFGYGLLIVASMALIQAYKDM